MKPTMIYFVALFSTVLALPACATPLTYSAEPMEARAIDADTKQPLQGVIVVAHWKLERGTVGGNIPAGELMVMETVTDKDGKFAFPGWGPKTVWDGFLINEDPELILFKSGYRYERLSNEYTTYREQRLRPIRRSEWSGKTIKLKPFSGTMEEYARHLGFMTTSLESILREECGWKKIPRMILTVNDQAAIFRKRGFYELPSIESLEVRYSNFKEKCGSVDEFFRTYKP